MDVSQLSRSYRVRRLMESDVSVVLRLCQRNPLYYEYCPPTPTEESICGDMTALPPGKTADDKYYVGFYDSERLIAVLDLITAYPDAETAYIGFFMTDAAVQRRGVGSRIVSELCAHLAQQGFKAVKLGWMQGNPQSEHFWHKNGFAETGEVHERDGRPVVFAQRLLSSQM